MPKIIKISGGLGNQLFQYAYGRKLELIDNKKIIFDISSFHKDIFNSKDTARTFLLNKFNLATKSEFKNIKRNIIQNFFHKIKNTILLRLIRDYNLYQSEKYFKDIKDQIIGEIVPINPLSLDAQNILNQIRLNDNPISIHIRRGDYVNNTHHNLCSMDYYKEAIIYIKSKINNPSFFIFSDDIEWVKNNLAIEDARYVSNPNLKEYEEMILMSTCKHNIIANSTFSWWSAYLNKNYDKIIIAPKQWTVNNTADDLGILPETWIQI